MWLQFMGDPDRGRLIRVGWRNGCCGVEPESGEGPLAGEVIALALAFREANWIGRRCSGSAEVGHRCAARERQERNGGNRLRCAGEDAHFDANQSTALVGEAIEVCEGALDVVQGVIGLVLLDDEPLDTG